MPAATAAMAALTALTSLAAWCLPAAAQDWPQRPVRIILSQPPGSSPDIIARILSDRLSRNWGQAVIVDNRPGGQNVIGAQAAARATPDGQTFFYATTAALVINAYTFKSLPYDPQKAFTPVGMVGRFPFVIVAHPDVAAKSLPELVALARRDPGKLAIATEGPRTFGGMVADMLQKVAGIQLLNVPFANVTAAVQDTIAGRTQLAIASVPAVLPHVKRGALRTVTASAAARVPGIDAGLVSDSYKGFSYEGWHAVVAPAGTPAAAIRRFNADLDGALRDPDMLQRLSELGPVTNGAGTPQQLAQFLKDEHARWARLARELGVQPE
jgi:tripartite-type tricarboxylate transporter receptor subunit TctC